MTKPTVDELEAFVFSMIWVGIGITVYILIALVVYILFGGIFS